MQRDPADLAAAIAARGLAPCYLVSGDEPLQQAETLDLLRAQARARGFEERVVHDVDASFHWHEFAQSAASLSLFASRRLIELRMPSGKPGVEGAKALREYAARPSPDDLLLVSTGRLDKQTSQAEWVKALAGLGDFVPVEPVARPRLAAWIQRRAAARSLRLSEEAAGLLAERVEGNLLAAAQEVELLALLHAPGAAGAPEVLAAVADSARYSSFELAECAFAGDAERALRMLRGLQREGVEAVPVNWLVVRDLRVLCLAAAAQQRGEPVERVLARPDLRVWESRRGAYKTALRRHRITVLHGLLRYALRIDRVSKGAARGEPWQMLGWLLLRLAGAPVAGALFDERVN